MPDSDDLRPRVLPVLQEDLEVRRERTETGALRLRIASRHDTAVVPLESWAETAELERVRVDRPASERRQPWLEADVLVVPVYEERVVVQRQLVLVEELRLRTVRSHHTEDLEVVLRRDEVQVERREAGGAWTASEDEGGPAGPAASTHQTPDRSST